MNDRICRLIKDITGAEIDCLQEACKDITGAEIDCLQEACKEFKYGRIGIIAHKTDVKQKGEKDE